MRKGTALMLAVATGRITAKTESLILSLEPVAVHNPHRKIRAAVTAIAPERREDENSNCHHSGYANQQIPGESLRLRRP